MITVILPPPVSANRYWAHRIVTPKGGRPMALTYVTPEAKAYKEQVGWILKAAGVRQALPGRVQVDIQMYPYIWKMIRRLWVLERLSLEQGRINGHSASRRLQGYILRSSKLVKNQ